MRLTVITCLGILALSLTGYPLVAGERMSSQGLACDTVAQVERFADVVGEVGDHLKALAIVNEEFRDPERNVWACIIGVPMMYERGDKVSEKTIIGGVIETYEATMFAIQQRNGKWMRMPPVKQYLPFFVPKVARGTAI